MFTPKGELITLPKDASVLDLAFTLHTEIGMHCIAGKINHKLVPLSHKLSSGDQVEVLTSNSQQPQAEWEKFLVTAKGKTRLRAALRQDRRAIIDKGEAMLKEFLQKNEMELDSTTLTRLISAERAQNKEELYMMIGNKEIALTAQTLKNMRQPKRFIDKIFNPFGGKSKEEELAQLEPNAEKIDLSKTYELALVNGRPNYITADCCRPIAGDNVVAFVNNNNQVVVHKMDCPTALKLKSSYGGQIVNTRWAAMRQKFLASISIEGIDRLGILQEIIYLISTNLAINIRKLNIGADGGVFHCELDVFINDTEVVNKLCKRLKKVKGVNSAVRIT